MSIITEDPAPVNKELQFGKYTFLTFQEVEWPKTGGVDMDALPTKPVSLPVSRIREMRPAKTWKTWDNTMEIGTGTGNKRIAVRGAFDEIVKMLNEHVDGEEYVRLTPTKKTRKPFEPFALTPRETRIQRMREDGYGMNEIAVAFNERSSLRIAMDFTAIDKKLEAAAARRRPADEFADALHSGGGRISIPATKETLAMMKDPNIHPDAIT